MGFTTLLDIIGSIIIGGFLLLLLWRIDDAAVKNVYNGTQELILQRNLTTSVEVLEKDFRRIGYCRDYTLALADTTANIVSATDTSITFKTDIYDAGNINNLTYYVGPISELASTPNPRDRYLYRVVDNDAPVGVNLGITQFRLVYFNLQGDTLKPPIANRKLIASVEVNVAVENVEGYGEKDEINKYSTAYWRQIRVSSMNKIR